MSNTTSIPKLARYIYGEGPRPSTVEGADKISQTPKVDRPPHSENEKSPANEGADEIFQTRDTPQIASPRDSGSYYARRGPKHEFKTYLLDEKCEKPWMKDKLYKAPRKSNWMIYIFIFLAFGFSALLNWRVATSVKTHDYCLILNDSFSSLDEDVWTHLVQVDGFGTGSFDWTTTDSLNAFTDDEGLHIIPTLTTATTNISAAQILDGYALNLTKTDDGDGSCTADQSSDSYNEECSVLSNSTAHTIVPSVRSARLTTQGSRSITYGRVEVTAKLPQGDWLWPAIWMMPEDSVYGIWPLSGEIDIMESRGNKRSKAGSGRETFSSTLHWGPSVKEDSWFRTTHIRTIKRSDFTDGFHTYGMEWSKDYLYTYIDNRLQQVMYVDFTRANLWNFGQFEGRTENGSALTNPWFKSANKNAPFDQSFHLILNVAVGSRNGWFPDGLGDNKPWVNGRDSAAADFNAAQDQWLPTWGKGNDRGMTVKNVKMWQEGKCQN